MIEFSADYVLGLTDEIRRLEHSLADAMEHIAAIQGTNATHMARVKELEECEALVREANANFDRMVELVERLRAAQKPRPMSEAPRDVEIAMVVPITWRASGDWYDRDGDPHDPDSLTVEGHRWTLGWLPLPDQGGEGES